MSSEYIRRTTLRITNSYKLTWKMDAHPQYSVPYMVEGERSGLSVRDPGPYGQVPSRNSVYSLGQQ